VIEDASDLRDLWAYELERVGFNVFRAEDGEAGIREVQRVDPILIVLDLMLPRLNGFSVARWVRELDRGRDVAILAVSALTHETLRREAFDAGCDAFLAKPTTGEAVILEATRLVGGKALLKRRCS
jgi:DNA-binding response OmpR family regulator